MKVKQFHIFYLSLAMLLLTLVASPVFAIANPDVIQVKQVTAFRNYVESGDLLFIIEYNVHYDSIPVADPRLAYAAQIYNKDTGTIVGHRPLLYYGHAYQSLYYTTAQAATAGLTWNMDDLVAVVTANPVLFPSVI